MDSSEIDRLVATHPDNTHRVFAAQIDGRRVFIKQMVKTFPNRAAEIFDSGMTRLTRRKESAPLDQEQRRIRDFRDRGFIVPDIIHRTANYLVISDIGPDLEKLMDTADAAERERLQCAAAQTLRRLHDAGGWHGAAGLRNLTQSRDGIGFIDLENTVESFMPLGLRKVWDLWSLSHSAGLFDHTGGLTAAGLRAYGRGATQSGLWAVAALFIGSYVTLKPFQPLRKRELRQTIGAMAGIFAAGRHDNARS